MSSSKLLIQYALRYPGLMMSSVILGVGGAVLNGVGTTLVVPIVLGIIGEKMIDLQGFPPMLQRILSLFDVFAEDVRLFAMIGTVLLAIILKNVANYGNTMVGVHLARCLRKSMQTAGIQLLLDVDLDYYHKHQIGELTSCINRETGRTSGAIKIAIRIFMTAISILTLIWVLLLLSWQITLITTSLLLLIGVVNQYFVKRSKYYGEVVTQKSRAYNQKLIEILTGIRLIKTVENEAGEYEQIKKLIAEQEDAEYQSQANGSLIAPFNEISGIILILIIIIIGRYLFAEQLQAVATLLLTYLVVLFRLIPFVSQFNGARSQFANAAPSAAIVAEFLRRDNKPFMGKGQEKFSQLKAGIKFEGVSFAYPGNGTLVLKGIDLWLEKGQTIALVGASGAGKSTLADLLPRFYDPTEGRITIDGKDIREYDLKTLRKAMGVVSQDTFLFNNSVRYNIAYGLENVSEAEIITAAKRANADEFIQALPKGLDTEIGDRGVLLSGGQRQRIAIARALLRNPQILIFDEATSALDTFSEKLVQQAINEVCNQRTTIVIAHRLSTIQKAHQIVVLNQGKIVEIGNHETLLAKGGYYAHLYSIQFANESHQLALKLIQEDLSGFTKLIT
ncbi:MAG: ABC transporter ATP-binding protein/permease [Gomphosphaeria aponina SAG 52.96 = DSM 107014]|uniref:ABC transporter ATP-binding protein/permease n=1 Tax=Gomphosphaeria aponina SAG 52.96 = DSM 107014 TaxID=1521640 RepID=A0A941GWA0_9CHRO|nr:ABC transporter ATP-binding protein/permease [Gomphosphaeria aponina SAG 52.96 = DSM 107014]